MPQPPSPCVITELMQHLLSSMHLKVCDAIFKFNRLAGHLLTLPQEYRGIASGWITTVPYCVNVSL